MERVIAAAGGFLGDGAAVSAATEVDRLRERALPDLTEAFVAFRDADESLQRLADRITKHMRRTWQPASGGGPQNLWGFRNEEESRFLERFLAAAPRLPEVDLASLLRSHLEEEPQSDDERIQVLLAFAEFVAGLDQKGRESDRLGVGPAAHFLTFAWHCLTRGREPVFTWAGDRGVRALLGGGGGRDWEARIQAFYEVARVLIDETPARPPTMRDGWAVEHVLAWVVERGPQGGESGGAARPTIVPAPRHHEPAAAPRPASHAPPPQEEPAVPLRSPGSERRKLDRISQITKRGKRLEEEEPLEEAQPPEPPQAPETTAKPKKKTVRMEADRLPHSGAALEDYHGPPATPEEREETSGERAQLEARARKKVKVVEADRLRATGMSMDEALPRDRTPHAGQPRPEGKKPESKKTASGATPTVPRAPEAVAAQPGGFKTAAMLMREARERDEGSQVEPLEDVHDAVTPAVSSPRHSETAASPRHSASAPTPPPVAPRPTNPTVTPVQAAPHWTPPEPAPRERAGATPVRSVPRPERARAPRLEDSDSDAGVPLEQLVSELRGEVIQANAGTGDGPTLSPDRLARDLLLDAGLTGDLLAALEERGRLLLVGPPATGKTHIARRLAIHTAGHIDRILFLRVHPELRYQALLEGGPGTQSGASGPGQPGLVRDWCERARRDRERRWALVLDELDRGDAARCLGELVGALVERGKGVLLASGAELVVPRNLTVIATAREEPTDPALVGRFPILPLEADPEVLRRFLSQVRPGCEWVADLLSTLNQRLAGQGHGFRVGHGLFIDPDLDPSRLRRIWSREVLPLLRCHGIATDGLEYDQIRPR